MTSIRQNIGQTLRSLARTPGFTGLAILALALGIGANTAVFSVFESVLLKPIDLPRDDQLIQIMWTGRLRGAITFNRLTQSDFRILESQATALSRVALYDVGERVLSGGAYAEKVIAPRVTSKYFEVLQVPPIVGRLFQPADESADGGRLCVLSYGLWQRQFGSDRSVLGKTIALDSQPCDVIGVLQQSFRFPERSDVWVLLPLVNREENRIFESDGVVLARLATGVSLSEARVQLETIASRLNMEDSPREERRFHVVRIRDEIAGDYRPVLWLSVSAVAILLLLASANVANLFLARGQARERELAIRAALGATRARIIALLLRESFVLSVAGGILGLVLAAWGVRTFQLFALPNSPRIEEISLSVWAVLFTLTISIVAALLSSLLPAIRVSKQDVQAALKEAGNAAVSSGLRHQRLRKAFVLSQVGLTYVLVVGAALLVQSFARLTNVSLGFDTDHVLTMTINLPPAKYKSPEVQSVFRTQLLERVRETHGVQGAALSSVSFFQNTGPVDIFVTRDDPRAGDRLSHIVARYLVTSDFFRTLRMHILAGRGFSDDDMRGDASVVVVNEAFVRQFIRSHNPIGEEIGREPRPDGKGEWYQIVGVVADTRAWGAKYASLPSVYIPMSQKQRELTPTLFVRTTDDPVSLAPSISTVVRSIESEAPLTRVGSLDQLYAENVAAPRFRALVFSIFGGLGLALALVGIYAAIAHSVTQRSHEIGVRMALGAQKRDVLWLILRESMVFTGVGIILGLVGAFALTRFLQSFLYEVKPTDTVTFLAVALLMLLAALAASYFPMRRALGLDPVVILRYE